MALFNIQHIIEQWGIIGKKAGDEYYALCPLHGDKSPSMSINLYTGAWICYTGCGAGKTIFSLGARMFDTSYAVVKENHETFVREPTLDEIYELCAEEGSSIVNEFESYQSAIAQRVKGFPKWFLDRGFDAQCINEFDIWGDNRDASIWVPVWFKERFKGGVKRLSPIEANSKGFRYYLPSYLQKNELLFNYDNIVKQMRGGVKLAVALCEGVLDCIWLNRAGIPAVSMLGLSLSRSQWTYLLDFDHIILALDNDEEGKKAHEKIKARAFPIWELSELVYPAGKKDPQDLSIEYLQTKPLRRILI